MKIFYAVQATGNGHISRAIEILPYLQEYGEVDIFLSGSNYSLKSNLPIAYRSKGLSLKYQTELGQIDILETLKSISIRKMWNEAKFLPVEKYDLVINDFECITSLACRLKKVKSVHFGHQASFSSKKVPRPKKREQLPEWIFSNYAKSSSSVGLHFKAYDKNIFTPIIRKSILEAEVQDFGHITVYLGQYNTTKILSSLKSIKDQKFEVFSSDIKEIRIENNIKLLPISHDLFVKSLVNCHGIITGAGFETPAEALYLRKKLLVIPLKGQYEQLCNAEALREFNVPVVSELNESFITAFTNWMNEKHKHLSLFAGTKEIIQYVVESTIPEALQQLPIQEEKDIFEMNLPFINNRINLEG
jgi:uncharacterized protein (TIGR00661 family)